MIINKDFKEFIQLLNDNKATEKHQDLADIENLE